jgi:hypothetical protein
MLAYGYHEDRTPTHGYEVTRDNGRHSPRAGAANRLACIGGAR